MARPKGRTTLGPSKQVTYRMPKSVYEKLEKIAHSMFQGIPTILRMAAVEYVQNHRPAKHPNTGIHLDWTKVPVETLEDEPEVGIEYTNDSTDSEEKT